MFLFACKLWSRKVHQKPTHLCLHIRCTAVSRRNVNKLVTASQTKFCFIFLPVNIGHLFRTILQKCLLKHILPILLILPFLPILPFIPILPILTILIILSYLSTYSSYPTYSVLILLPIPPILLNFSYLSYLFFLP